MEFGDNLPGLGGDVESLQSVDSNPTNGRTDY